MFHAIRTTFALSGRSASRYGNITRHTVGSDILLARHGDAIAALRPDRANGHVVAILTDGSLDTAPNLIDPTLTMPGHMSDDVKLIALVSSGTAALALAATIALFAYCSGASPEQLSNLATIMGSATTAM